ncbi:MAG: efflux RND transporter periplasmic adaptor subunit [Candidatus Sphingomonas phytovorans]|nr:efflux RND transporter periplasmic adaptor subunit [Sphingomonas sp.]WEJ99141.1 MAG: efflux RND transporter periplasmic adaptor subunit [Sphingomonas sp.]
MLALSLAACSKPSATNETTTTPTVEAMVRQGFVKVERVGDGSAGLGLALPGRVAFETAALAVVDTPVPARIVTLHVRPGEQVARGAALVTLAGAEVASARSAVISARARLAAAEDLLRRQNEMVKRGVGTEVERFGAETAARQARAELTSAERASALIGGGAGDTFTLRAPVAGTVLSIRGNVGAIADAGGESIMDIGDPSRLWVVADAAESELATIRMGMPAQVTVAGATVSARVEGLGSFVDSDQRRVPVYLRLVERPTNLTAGMFADVRFASDTAITVPVDAVLVKEGARRVVYVRDGRGKYVPRDVQVGASREGRVVITSGVHAGEFIVTHGALLLDSSAGQQL